ncbi:hypothetical protein C8R43DRAFT_1135673 [Mycena crocata]|nr:hypothetical protein C8R43DRAFT_1135673 [Mycena crocata]
MATLYDPYAEARFPPQITQTTSTLIPNRPAASGNETPSETDSIWTILLTAAAILLAVFVVGLGLVIQVFILHAYHITAGAVYTTAPLGRTLTIAHVSSVVVALSVPLTIGLGAYWLAGRWLRASRDEGIDRPTPYQLGLLMRTLNGANLSALWYSSNYMVGRGTVPGGKKLEKPPILRHAVLMLLAVLALAYASAGAEMWLGAASDAVLYPVVREADPGAALPLHSRRVNQTLCDEFQDSSNNKPYQCGLNRGSGGNPEAISARLLTMNGVSGTNVVAFTDDATAIMVPPPAQIPTNMDYTATTLGVKSICNSVTAQCIDPSNLGSNAGLDINCPASLGFNTTVFGCNPYEVPGILSTTGSPLSANGSSLPCDQNADSNDFRYGARVVSAAYYTPGKDDSFVGDTGFFLHGNKGGYNVLICEIKSLDVTYHYFNGSYTLLSAAPSDLAQGQRVSDGSVAGQNFVPPAVEGAGLSSGSYTDAFAAKLSQVALSMTSYVFEPAEALAFKHIEPNIGSRLPLAPLLLLFLFKFIYCSLVLTVAALAVLELHKSPHTSFARSRLVDPATAISTAYGPDEAKLKKTGSPQELFGDETAADRLNLGVSSRAEGLPAVHRSATLQARSPWEK